MVEKKQKNWKNQKLQFPPIKCTMCGRVIKHPLVDQKVCVYTVVKKQTKCQIKLNRLRSAKRDKRIQKLKNRAVTLVKTVICDQCGFEIKQPEYARLSPTRRQMRCSVKNGRPGQKVVGRYSGCQVNYQNDRQNKKRNEKRKRDEKIIKTFLVQMETSGSNGKPREYPENRKPATARGNYKQPDDEAPLKLGRPAGSESQKAIRGKYSNNGDRKLRECLGILCTEENKGRRFMSAGPFNRICPRCEAAELNNGGRQVKWAGMH